jgi:predicted ester cyclase
MFASRRSAPYLAGRLAFDCTPQGTFLDRPINGRRVTFVEHVIYEFRDRRSSSRERWSSRRTTLSSSW